VANNTSSEDGGGLWNDREVAITSSAVTGNTSRGETLGSLGGGLFLGPTNVGSFISNSNFSTNASAGLFGPPKQPPLGGFGGGAYSQGHLTILRSSFSDNTATQHGGGLMDQGKFASLRLVGSMVSHNTSRLSGGGIFNDGRHLELIRSVVVDNTPDNIATK